MRKKHKFKKHYVKNETTYYDKLTSLLLNIMRCSKIQLLLSLLETRNEGVNINIHALSMHI